MGPSTRTVNAVILLLCLIWGSTWLVIKKGLEDLPPLHAVALRFTLASAVFWLVGRPLARLEGGTRPPRWLVIVFGCFNFATSYGLVYWAETLLPSALASVLWAVFPMMMAVAGHVFLPGERLRGQQWIGFLVGFLGIVSLFQTDLRKVSAEAVPVGALYLLSPLVSAAGQTCVKRHGQGVSSVLLNRDALTLGMALLWAAALLFERDAVLVLTPAAVLSVAYLGVVGTCVAFGLYYWILRSTPTYKLSLIAYITPLIALFLGWSVGAEPIGPTTLLGTALVLLGVGLVRRG